MLKKKFIPRPKESAHVLKKRWVKKRDSIERLANNVQKLRYNVSTDLKSDNEKIMLTALVVAIMLKTGERVGNETSASNGHVGITGLKKKQVNVIGNKVILEYTGKSGVEHTKMFSDERIAKALKVAKKKSPDDSVFTTSNDFKIKSDRINRYLSEFFLSSKDIRGFSSNDWTIKKLKEIVPEDTEAKRKKQFNKIIRSIASKVGHGVATLKKHYLLPELEPNFVENGVVIDVDDVSKFNKGGTIDKTKKMDTSESNVRLSVLKRMLAKNPSDKTIQKRIDSLMGKEDVFLNVNSHRAREKLTKSGIKYTERVGTGKQFGNHYYKIDAKDLDEALKIKGITKSSYSGETIGTWEKGGAIKEKPKSKSEEITGIPIYRDTYHPQGSSSSPEFEIRGNEIFTTKFNDHYDKNAWYEIKDNKIYATKNNPYYYVGSSFEWFEIRGDEIYATMYNPVAGFGTVSAWFIIDRDKKMEKGGKVNPYAVCTTSIGKKEGTQKRSNWDKDAFKRYENCILQLKKKMEDGGTVGINYVKILDKNKKPIVAMKFKTQSDKLVEIMGDTIAAIICSGYSVEPTTEKEYREINEDFDRDKVDLLQYKIDKELNDEGNCDFGDEGGDVVLFLEKGGKIEFNKNKLPKKNIYEYALKIKKEYPKVWELGGNVFGNQAFKNLERVIKRGNWLENEKWMYVKWRSYVARHKEDFKIEGVIAMLKWVDEVDRGWKYMKDLIELEIKKKYKK